MDQRAERSEGKDQESIAQSKHPACPKAESEMEQAGLQGKKMSEKAKVTSEREQPQYHQDTKEREQLRLQKEKEDKATDHKAQTQAQKRAQQDTDAQEKNAKSEYTPISRSNIHTPYTSLPQNNPEPPTPWRENAYDEFLTAPRHPSLSPSPPESGYF